jgi:outer membrane lipoprotein-sorting protein
VGGATSALPTPPMVTVPEVLPALGTQPPETKPTTPTIPVVPATPPAVPPSAPVQPAAGTTKPDVKIHMTFGAPATDAGARYAAALADAKAAYAKVRDYSCHLKKVERINGKLQPEQTAELHARSKPASVYMKFIGPRDLVGMEACFVSGKFAGNAKFRVKPAGVLGIGGFQTMAINDSRVMATNRHTIDQVGIGALIDLLEKNAQIERQLNNSVAFSVAEYSFVNRPVTRYEMICNQPHAHRYCYKAVVYVDKETKLPVRFEAYDVPSAGAPEGELLECYSYVNLKLNPGHGAAVFDR